MSQNLNDSEIITGLKEGNKIIIDRVYNVYHRRIFAFAFSLLKVEEDALDVVHEVFVKLWKNRHELEPDTHMEPLIFTITRNTVLSIFRKQASEKKYQEHVIYNPIYDKTTNTENVVEYNFLKDKVDHYVQQLPPKSREVYLLSREQGLSNKEISRKMGIAEKTVEDHITKALAFLKKHLREIGITGTLFWYLFVW